MAGNRHVPSIWCLNECLPSGIVIGKKQKSPVATSLWTGPIHSVRLPEMAGSVAEGTLCLMFEAYDDQGVYSIPPSLVSDNPRTHTRHGCSVSPANNPAPRQTRSASR